MIATTLQKFLASMAALGALYLITTNSSSLGNLASAAKTAVGGTETEIITGGKN